MSNACPVVVCDADIALRVSVGKNIDSSSSIDLIRTIGMGKILRGNGETVLKKFISWISNKKRADVHISGRKFGGVSRKMIVQETTRPKTSLQQILY
jgi:hypothetical protein